MDKKETIGGNGHVAIHDWIPINEDGTHKTADEIEYDIEETRHTMDEILDTLTDRVNPSTIVNRFQQSLKKPENRERAKRILYIFGNRISDSFQRNPLPVMMIAAGVTWQLWETQRKRTGPEPAESTGEAVQSARETAEGKVSSAKERAQENIASAKGNVQEKTSSLRENAANAFESNKEKAKATFEQARQKGQHFISNAQEMRKSYQERSGEFRDHAVHSYKDTINRTDQRIHDNPLLFGAAAVFAGLIIGSLLPETRGEKQTVGKKAEETLQKAKETGEQAMQQGREVAKETAQTATEKAQQRELTPEQLASKAEHKLTNAEPSHREENIQKKPAEPAKTVESKPAPAPAIKNEALKSAEQKIDEKKVK